MKTIKVPLSVAGIDNAIREIDRYKSWLKARTSVLLDRLAQEGLSVEMCIRDSPKPPAGGKGGEMTKADFLKLDTKAQLEFIKEHSDWQTILK